LVEAVIGWARSEGAKIVRLKVIQRNHRARSFYARMGFCPTGIEVARERDGMIEVEMERGDDHTG
jgi:GNAT superfamily N-acetyltransferase